VLPDLGVRCVRFEHLHASRAAPEIDAVADWVLVCVRDCLAVIAAIELNAALDVAQGVEEIEAILRHRAPLPDERVYRTIQPVV